ncbi:MAG: Crp/Fnr family transcriptional regulator [Sphingomonadaceae bacterium]|nr:Crp/Fnr family transcriptional regulator [Sphingomonadaceae bacterium]
MIEQFLKKLRARDEISLEEEDALRASVSGDTRVAADTLIIRQGDTLSESTLLLEGITCRFKDLLSGERQITELNVAGDFIDLHSFSLKRLDHGIMALTPCRIAPVPHSRIAQLIDAFPHLGRIFWFLTNLDAAIHREWVLSLGRRHAAAKLAAFLCEMHIRLGIVGLADDAGFALGITQEDVAECLGLTSVHVNRTLRELRERCLAQFRSGRVELLNLEGLRELAEFDPSYLYLDRMRGPGVGVEQLDGWPR